MLAGRNRKSFLTSDYCSAMWLVDTVIWLVKRCLVPRQIYDSSPSWNIPSWRAKTVQVLSVLSETYVPEYCFKSNYTVTFSLDFLLSWHDLELSKSHILIFIPNDFVVSIEKYVKSLWSSELRWSNFFKYRPCLIFYHVNGTIIFKKLLKYIADEI